MNVCSVCASLTDACNACESESGVDFAAVIGDGGHPLRMGQGLGDTRKIRHLTVRQDSNLRLPTTG